MTLHCLCHTKHKGCAASVCAGEPVHWVYTHDHEYRLCDRCWGLLVRIGAVNIKTGRYIVRELR